MGGKKGRIKHKNDPFSCTFKPTNPVHDSPPSIARRTFLLSLRVRSSSVVVDGAPLAEAEGARPMSAMLEVEKEETGGVGGATRSLGKSEDVRECWDEGERPARGG